MLVTFILVFREALEAFLLVGILLVYLNRLGAKRKGIWIYLGAAAGLLASLAVAFILQVVVDQLSDKLIRGILTAVMMLIATVILTYMAIWMHRQARSHTEDARRKLAEHVSAGRVFGIAALAFVSVLREGVETVLFLSALAFGGEPISLNGALLGIACAILAVWLLLTSTRRVPIGPFFRYTSLLLIIVAAGLLGSAVNQLQGQGLIPGPTGAVFDLSSVLPDTSGAGVFLRGLFGYNATPTLQQFLLWAAYLVVAVSIWRRDGARTA